MSASQLASSRSLSSSKTNLHVKHIIAHQREEVEDTKLRERLLAEFVGTFFLVLTVGLAVAGGSPLAAVAIGLVLAVQIYTFGSVSGAFLNPAVTLAVLLSGREKISPGHAAMYAGVQLLGGLFAGFIALATTETSFCFDYELLGKPWHTSFILETLFTAALCGTVLATGTSNDAPNHYFGFAIGCTVVGGALACGGFDQGSFNPAVTVGMNFANYANGSAAVNPSAGAWLVFLLGPLTGASAAAAIFRGTRGNEYQASASQQEATSAEVVEGKAEAAV